MAVKRRKPQYPWHLVEDWQRPREEIAAQMGCHINAVTKARKRYGQPNGMARRYRITSPWGRTFEVVSILDFVRDNEGLFAEADVRWADNRSGKPFRCRASAGLYKSASTGPPWKGWTCARKIKPPKP